VDDLEFWVASGAFRCIKIQNRRDLAGLVVSKIRKINIEMEKSNYLNGKYFDIFKELLNRDSGFGSIVFDELFNGGGGIELDLRGLDVRSHGYNRGKITVPEEDEYVELCIDHFEFGHHRRIKYVQDVPYVVSGAASAIRAILIKRKINYIGKRFWMSYSGHVGKLGVLSMRRIADRPSDFVLDQSVTD
jgi:hypothetical protein